MTPEPGKSPQFLTGRVNVLRLLENEIGLTPAPGKPLDPVNLLSPVIEIFLPVTLDGTTMLGLWFDTAGLLHIYVQQAIAPDNIFAQVKIITLRLPIALGFTLFSVGLGLFFARSTYMATRLAAVESLRGAQKTLQQMIDQIRQTPVRAGSE